MIPKITSIPTRNHFGRHGDHMDCVRDKTLSNICFTLPLWGKKLEGMEKGLIKVFEVEEYYNSVQLEEGTKESCHPRE